jgi:uncharacterized membrane protein YoaK (UPF0700 family)
VDIHVYRLGLLLLIAAGWVDAVGFLNGVGMFVSFMSGNTTQLGVFATEHQPTKVVAAAAGLGVFVIGVILGELLRGPAGKRHRSAVLIVEAVILGVAATLSWRGSGISVALLLGLAMGLQNLAFQRAEGISMGLTYVTGTLVQFGRAVGEILSGRGGWRKAATHGWLWLALLAGATGGGLASRWNEASAIGLACLLVALATGISFSIGPSDDD